MTELEKKVLLTKDEYDYLMEHFSHNDSAPLNPIVKQINYYYDTDDLSMNQQDITCRIRLKGGKYKGTMKKHSFDSDFSTEIDMDIQNGLEDNAFTTMGLKLQGELVTERCIILEDEVCEVVLDKNEYLGYTDYELEIEYNEAFEHYAERILNIMIDSLVHNSKSDSAQHTYNQIQQVPSKSKRFFQRMSNTKTTVQKCASKFSNRNTN